LLFRHSAIIFKRFFFSFLYFVPVPQCCDNRFTSMLFFKIFLK
jgi:hypothetical protein